MEDKNFIKGFNNGYVLREYKPELIEPILAGIIENNTYFDGLKEGIKQRDSEIARDRMKGSIEKDTPSQQPERDR